MTDMVMFTSLNHINQSCKSTPRGLITNFGDFFTLTLYSTIPTFNDPEKEAIGKHSGKRRKCW